MMKNVVYLVGASDRFNYGDLLFPQIFKKILLNENRTYLTIRHVGLIESNLSKYGGLPTVSLKKMYKEIFEKQGNYSITIMGGEVLGPSWIDLLRCINFIFNTLARNSRINRYFNLNNIAKSYLGGRTENAYILERGLLKSNINLIYNSVGGINLPYHDSITINRILKHLDGADYISVRDSYTYNNLKSLGLKKCLLVPDCAILISELFSKDFLISKILKQNEAKYKHLSNSGYIFFQVNKTFGKKYLSDINEILTSIYKTYNLNIILCPIGKALIHEDDFPLKLISSKLSVPHIYFKRINIWEIMYLISNAKIFIGTSLHGIITAMSFLVPYIGIFKENQKINKYLATWGINNLNQCLSPKEILPKVGDLIGMSKDFFRTNRELQIDKVKESLNIIKSTIM
jgi:hypothetical protein